MAPLTALLVLTSAAAGPLPSIAPGLEQQDTLTVREAEPGLKAQAKVAADSAMKIALAKVPAGKIREAELEREHGRVVYSFDITEPKRSGVQEVLIDARTGMLISSKHESAAAEAKERAAESKHARNDTTSHDAAVAHDSAKQRR